MQKPLPLGEVASRSDDGEGKPVSREPPCSDKLSLWQSDAIAAPALLRQHPCPLRRSAPALPKGEPLAKRAGFAGCKSLSPWERWHRAAMTERASPSPESRHAAISCLFGRAMLSLRLLFSVSVLALSGAPRQLSQRESLKGEPKSDGFSPFTQERGRFAQVLLIFSPQMWYI